MGTENIEDKSGILESNFIDLQPGDYIAMEDIRIQFNDEAHRSTFIIPVGATFKITGSLEKTFHLGNGIILVVDASTLPRQTIKVTKS